MVINFMHSCDVRSLTLLLAVTARCKLLCITRYFIRTLHFDSRAARRDGHGSGPSADRVGSGAGQTYFYRTFLCIFPIICIFADVTLIKTVSTSVWFKIR